MGRPARDRVTQCVGGGPSLRLGPQVLDPQVLDPQVLDPQAPIRRVGACFRRSAVRSRGYAASVLAFDDPPYATLPQMRRGRARFRRSVNSRDQSDDREAREHAVKRAGGRGAPDRPPWRRWLTGRSSTRPGAARSRSGVSSPPGQPMRASQPFLFTDGANAAAEGAVARWAAPDGAVPATEGGGGAVARWAAPDGAVPAAEGAVAAGDGANAAAEGAVARWAAGAGAVPAAGGAVAAAAPYSPTQRYAGEKPLAKSGVGAVVSRR